MTVTATVKLAKPLKGTGGLVDSFTFREPRFEDYMLIGDPRVAVPSGEEDKVFLRPIPDDIRRYAERLLVGGDPNVLANAGLRDTLAIQKVIMGFFRDAESDEAETRKKAEEAEALALAEKALPTVMKTSSYATDAT